jgi:hypothetical protein
MGDGQETSPIDWRSDSGNHTQHTHTLLSYGQTSPHRVIQPQVVKAHTQSSGSPGDLEPETQHRTWGTAATRREEVIWPRRNVSARTLERSTASEPVQAARGTPAVAISASSCAANNICSVLREEHILSSFFLGKELTSKTYFEYSINEVLFRPPKTRPKERLKGTGATVAWWGCGASRRLGSRPSCS